MDDIKCFYRAFRVWEKKVAVKNSTRDDFTAQIASKSQISAWEVIPECRFRGPDFKTS